MIDSLLRKSVGSLSQKLAEYIHRALAESLSSFPSRGIKKGDFDVLHSLSMPRVLVEIGFVDTRAGAKFFSDKGQLIRISKQIAQSIADFFTEMS